jgi:hypothetical protein
MQARELDQSGPHWSTLLVGDLLERPLHLTAPARRVQELRRPTRTRRAGATRCFIERRAFRERCSQATAGIEPAASWQAAGVNRAWRGST